MSSAVQHDVAGQTTQSTFGNWRQPATPGLLGLGLIGTCLMLGFFAVGIVLMMISLPFALLWLTLATVALVPVSLRRDGRSGWSRMAARIAWAQARSTRRQLYRSGITGVVPGGRHRLPGVAAQTALFEAHDAYGQPFGIVHVPSTGHYSAVLRCEADGATLVDRVQIESWVASWGMWLASLAHEPGLAAAAVTVETAPDPGTRLQAEVAATLQETAPLISRQALAEIVASYPTGSAMVSTRIQLTYRAGSSRGVRDVEAMAAELGSRIPVLRSSLATTGAGAASFMTAAEIAEVVRTAYDPATGQLLDLARLEGRADEPAITWADAGPVAANEAWDYYQHDSGVSVSWTMSEAPRGTVLSSVLDRLVAPSADIPRKRVTLLYRPHDPATAAQLVESDVRTARFAATSRRDGSARDDLGLRAARQSAAEEAAGAGLLRFSMLVTATAYDLRARRGRRSVRFHPGLGRGTLAGPGAPTAEPGREDL
jgi:hypothetical protein